MTNADRIIAALGAHGPLTDSDLRRLTGVEPHQQVNQICRRLEARGELRRVPGPDGRILNVRARSSSLLSKTRQAPVGRTAKAPASGNVAAGSVPAPGPPVDRAMLVIPCSGAKAVGGRPGLTGPSVLGLLPAELAAGLRSARAAVALPAGLDESRLLPAWCRYTGSLYAAAGEALGRLIAQGQPLAILSGGYGLALAEEPIGWYDRAFRRADWPAGLLEACLVAVARRLGAARVLAFCARTTGYANLVRRVRWSTAGLEAALISPEVEGRGGAQRVVPQAAGQALAAAMAGSLTSAWKSPGGVLVRTEALA